ncbi:MAG TPA: hypothetical protein VEQ16_11865 [Acidocella sp.]|nr:hypothetical protein [Acidocella sp.]
MRAITATVTPGATSAMARMDNYASAGLAVQIVASGGAAFSLRHSHDDPNELVNPVPVGSMVWGSSLLPTGAANGTSNISFVIMAAPLWMQFNLTNATGSARAIFLQVGTHSHSNIASGPFAPPHLMQATREGTNYGAIAK